MDSLVINYCLYWARKDRKYIRTHVGPSSVTVVYYLSIPACSQSRSRSQCSVG